MQINTLRQQITAVIEGVSGGDSQPDGLATGVPELDSLLPSNGIPRGRITELLGVQGAGRTSFLRRIVHSVVNSGLWVAYIDASRTLAPANWARIGERNTLWVVRPPPGDSKRGAWCADVLLRSGAFALVVLDGAPALPRAIAVRLSRLARDTSSAFIVTGDDRSGSMIGGSLRLRAISGRRTGDRGRGSEKIVIPAKACPGPRSADGIHVKQKMDSGFRRNDKRCFAIRVEKGGNPKIVEVRCAIGVESRLCAHPSVPDRRGVARGNRGKWGSIVSGISTTTVGRRKNAATPVDEQTRGNTATAAVRGAGDRGRGTGDGRYTNTLARKRRCAEPDIHVGTFTAVGSRESGIGSRNATLG